MSEDINKIINELHIYEKKLLKELEINENATPDEIAENTGLNIKSVMSAAGSLASKGIIIVNKETKEKFSLTDNGKKYAEIGLPERRILKVLQDKKQLAMKDLAGLDGLDKKEVNISIGWLVRKSWAKMDKGVLSITDVGESSKEKLGDDESLLRTLIEKAQVSKEQLDEDMAKGLSALKERKNLIAEQKTTLHSFELTDLGREILELGFTIEEEATQLTHQQLKEGSWKDLKYRPYDINAEYPIFFPGKEHPLRRIIQEIREIFLNMGFTEDKGDYLESAFWNFDSLFQPQDHAAREMQDTFYVKNPLTCDLPDDELVQKVARTHEDGGNTSSEGWNYDWDEDIARQSVLRTHTTGISTQRLAKGELPIKMFSVGRVFRRETFDYKHLPEFHQVEGLVAAPGINYQNLLGTLKEFYKKLGFEVRFRPAYFPYTYLSTECEIYLEEKESWIELGGCGMFRPEVLEPLGINTPALAFGLGIERLAMIRYDLSDIRMLYKSDISWLREVPLEEGVVVGSAYRKLADTKNAANAWGPWDPEKFTVEDSAFGFIKFKNGATVVLESAWALNTLEVEEASCMLCGTKGGADFHDGLRINGERFGKTFVHKPDLGAGGVAFYDGAVAKPEQIEAQTFYSAVIEGTPLVVKPEQALVVTRILDAIYESNRTGKPVFFD